MSAWRIRVATSDDAVALEAFQCVPAPGQAATWEVEVEDFVRHEVVRWAFDPYAQAAAPRLLLLEALPADELVGVVAHERVLLHDPVGARMLEVAKLEVVALAVEWQGRRFEDGDGPRASDLLMSAALRDVSRRAPAGAQRVMAVVHEDNVRSLALCRRHGLIEEISRPHPAYRRLVTPSRP